MCAQPEMDESTSVSLGFGDATATIGDLIAHFYRTSEQDSIFCGHTSLVGSVMGTGVLCTAAS